MKNIQEILRKKGLDGALLIDINSGEPNFFHTSGIHSDCGFLFVPKKGNSIVFVSGLELEAARKNCKLKVVELEKPMHKVLGKYIKKEKIGLNFCSIRLKTFYYLKKHLKLKFNDISDDLRILRMTKRKDEVNKIKKACNITDKVFSLIVNNFKFKTELELKNFIELKIKEMGCELAFNPVVATGKNTSMPHYKAGDVKLKKGFLLLDFGAKYKGYCSDMSRMLYLGKPSKKEIDEYKKLLSIQEGLIEQVKVGMRCSVLDNRARKKLGKQFIHSLGHGLGVEIHELPTLTPRSKDILVNNAVFTIEPGVYYPGKYGIRIEDTVMVDDRGKMQVLTRSSKELIKPKVL